MNIFPLIGFYGRHRDRIWALAERGNKGDGGHVLLDAARANVPFLKEHWPQLNAGGILDDALATLEEVLKSEDAVAHDPLDRRFS